MHMYPLDCNNTGRSTESAKKMTLSPRPSRMNDDQRIRSRESAALLCPVLSMHTPSPTLRLVVSAPRPDLSSPPVPPMLHGHTLRDPATGLRLSIIAFCDGAYAYARVGSTAGGEHGGGSARRATRVTDQAREVRVVARREVCDA